MRLYVPVIHLRSCYRSIRRGIEILEVLKRTPHHRRHLHILDNGRENDRDIINMRCSEVNVIIDESTCLESTLKECLYKWAQHRIHSEERTEYHDITLLHLRKLILYRHIGMILIELILRIVVFIKESK